MVPTTATRRRTRFTIAKAPLFPYNHLTTSATTTTTRSFDVSMPTWMSADPRHNNNGNNNNGNINTGTKTDKDTTTTTFKIPTKSTWRQLIKPFLLKCHPDVMASQQKLEQKHRKLGGGSTLSMSRSNSRTIKQTNLQAIQNLNVYLDTIQNVVQTVTESKLVQLTNNNNTTTTTNNKTKQQQHKQDVILLEFVLFVPDTTGHKLRKHKDPPNILIRRQVELIIPTSNPWLVTKLNDCTIPVTIRLAHFTQWIIEQLIHIVRIAGLPIPYHVRDELLQQTTFVIGQYYNNNNNNNKNDDRTRNYEPNFGQERNTTTSSSFRSSYYRDRLNAQRRAYTDSIDWNKVNQLYQQTIYEMKVELLNQDMIKNKPHRRMSIIANVLASIQIQRYGPKGIHIKNLLVVNKQKDDEGKEKDDDEEEKDDNNNNEMEVGDDDKTKVSLDDNNNDKFSKQEQQRRQKSLPEPKITLIEEVIAFRRLSLLLEEHFEELQLDDLTLSTSTNLWWERLQIILTPERRYNTSPSALHKRAIQDKKDNGFVFTFHTSTTTNSSTTTTSSTSIYPLTLYPHQVVTGRQQQQQMKQQQQQSPTNVSQREWRQQAYCSLTVPIDFRDDELLVELKRNMEQFKDMIGDGSDDIYKDGIVMPDPYAELLQKKW